LEASLWMRSVPPAGGYADTTLNGALLYEDYEVRSNRYATASGSVVVVVTNVLQFWEDFVERFVE